SIWSQLYLLGPGFTDPRRSGALGHGRHGDAGGRAAVKADRGRRRLVEVTDAVQALGERTEEVSTLSEALEQTQEQLDAQATRYLELFDLAPDGYLVTDANGVILESNRAASGLLGSPARFLYRKPVIVFVDAAARRSVLNHRHDALTVSAN